MVLMLDDGADAVALKRTKTVVAAVPNTLRARLDVLIDVHDIPLLRLYSIRLETPVIAF
jgi:hypothetical protein